MQDLTQTFERLLTHLADDLHYTLSLHEITLYTNFLKTYGLAPSVNAVLEILKDKRPDGTFPPISEFARILSRG